MATTIPRRRVLYSSRNLLWLLRRSQRPSLGFHPRSLLSGRNRLGLLLFKTAVPTSLPRIPTNRTTPNMETIPAQCTMGKMVAPRTPSPPSLLPRSLKGGSTSLQVSIRSSHIHSHHQHHHSPTMFFIFVLFVAAVLGTQTVAFVALIKLFQELQKYDERRTIHDEANKVDNNLAWGSWDQQN